MTNQKTIFTRLLGLAFLIQASTSLIGNAIFLDPLVIDNQTQITLENIANNESNVQISIFLEIVTATVIILLGVLLYSALKHYNHPIALLGLTMYIFEACSLFVVETLVILTLKTSQLYAQTNDPQLIYLGEIFIFSKTYTYRLMIISFGIGAIAFYYLLLKSNIIPKALALWGLVTIPIILIGVPLMNYGIETPFLLFLPYVPFEFVTGIYILIKGLKTKEAI